MNRGPTQKIATRAGYDFSAKHMGLSESQEACLRGEISIVDCVKNFTSMLITETLANSKTQAEAARRLGIGRTTLVEFIARENGTRNRKTEESLKD